MSGPYIGTLTPPKKKPAYTADQVAASLAANPQASHGGYEGSVPLAGPNTDNPTTLRVDDPGKQNSGNPFETNPGYLAALAAEQSGSQQADAALRAAQEAAIVGYGDPSIAAALGIGNVSENTGAAARANYLAGNSSLAKLDRQKGQQESSSVNNLAAHGILFSGETGYQRGEIGKNYGNAVYDTQQALLGGLNAASQQANDRKQALHSQTIGALMGAYDTAIANPGAFGVTGIPDPSNPATMATLPTQTGATAGAPQSSAFGGTAGPYIGTLGKSKLAAPRKPLTNPYSTGQKRFG